MRSCIRKGSLDGIFAFDSLPLKITKRNCFATALQRPALARILLVLSPPNPISFPCSISQGVPNMRYLHTMLRVRNLDAALKFYQDALGLKEVRRIDNDKAKFTL